MEMLIYLFSPLHYQGCIIWFTGLSGSGKSTLAYTVEHALASRGKLAYVLDGDNIRHGLCSNLTFTKEGEGAREGRSKSLRVCVCAGFLRKFDSTCFFLFLKKNTYICV